jgi:hypothetical protein
MRLRWALGCWASLHSAQPSNWIRVYLILGVQGTSPMFSRARLCAAQPLGTPASRHSSRRPSKFSQMHSCVAGTDWAIRDIAQIPSAIPYVIFISAYVIPCAARAEYFLTSTTWERSQIAVSSSLRSVSVLHVRRVYLWVQCNDFISDSQMHCFSRNPAPREASSLAGSTESLRRT